ncbi:MAG: TPM domain-containing protein [Geobacter sp.]|nr:TPM domain-containing protein [Geobacter sp.]
MRCKPYNLLLLLLMLFICLPQPATALDAPPLKGRINDYAGMLSPATARSLEQKLVVFEKETTNQVVLLTIPSLEGDVIESYAIRVAEAWKIGQKDKSNGVILILAKKERKIRIEVGTGLQGVLPDITAGQIIRSVIAPALRAGNPDQGISAGLGAIIDATKGEFKATAADQKAAKKKKGSGYGLFIILLLAGLVITAVAGSSSRTAGILAGGVSLPAAVGIGLGAVLWKLGILALLGGAAGFLISLLMRLFNASGGSGGGYGGGWGGPTIFYGGGGGGSSSSDDSFSGGGGDFDGGGSSDDW